MSFRELLGRLAAEHEALQVQYDRVISENNMLRSRLSCNDIAEKDREVLRPNVRQLEQEADHMMLLPSTPSTAAEPGEASDSEPEDMKLQKHQRQFRLRSCFLIKDEDLLFMRPSQYDLDAAMAELHSRQRAEKKITFFRENVCKAQEGQKKSSRVVMHPAGTRRLIWDFTSIFMLLYDCIMTPLTLVMDTEPVGIFILGWIVNGFWTLDILASFATGFYQANHLVMDLPTIAKHYLPSWFMFDVAVILPDWIALSLKSNPKLSEPLSTVRVFKMIRFLRLMRLLKLKRLAGDILGRISSDSLLQTMRLLRLLAAIIMIMHVIACFWFLIGDHQDGWAAALRGADLAHRYFDSLNWSLSQMQGQSSVVPVTTGERIYASITILISLGLVSVLIGATTSAWQNDADFSRDLTGQRSAFRSIVQRHNISLGLDMQIREYLEGQTLLHDTINRERKLMKVLPNWLLKELLHEIRGKSYARHPLFHFLGTRNGVFMRHVCCNAMAGYYTQPGEVIFNAGDACIGMRFVTDEGTLKYVHRSQLGGIEDSKALTSNVTRHFEEAKRKSLLPSSSRILSNISNSGEMLGEWEASSTTIEPGQFLSEAAIWTLWENCGMCLSASWGTLLLVAADDFQNILTQYPEMHWIVVLYARQFILLLNRTPISDLMSPPSVNEWDLEAVDACNNEEQTLPWEEELPSHIRGHVVKAAVNLSQMIASEGLDENRPHHGFVVIVGDEKALASCGRAGFNPFQGHDLQLVNKEGGMDKDVFETLRRNAFHGDGAILLDGRSGKVVASGWFVGDIRLGGSSGGARSRCAKAVAQQAGECYVIKCSEDSRGKLILHLGTNVAPFTGKLKTEDGVPLFAEI